MHSLRKERRSPFVLVLRRFLAVLLGILVIPIVVLALLLLQINSTFLNPEFYVDQLRKGDVYNFAYDVAPSLVAEATQGVGDLPLDIGPLAQEAVVSVKEVFPPAWIQGQVEATIRGVLPYATGGAAGFTLTVALKDRVQAAGPALEGFIRRSQLFDQLYDKVLPPLMENLLPTGQAPLPIPIDGSDLVARVKNVLPPAWLNDRVGDAIDSTLPYLTKEQEHFVLVVPLKDRVAPLGEELKGLLRESEATADFRDTLVKPLLAESLGAGGALPFGLSLTAEELDGVISSILSDEWVEGRFAELIDALAGYLTGGRETFSLTIPLGDRKAAAVTAFTTLVDRKLEAYLASRPPCSLQQVASLDLSRVAAEGLPCLPPGTDVRGLMASSGVDLRKVVADLVAELPDSFILGEAEVDGLLGPQAMQLLQDARRTVIDGVRFTDGDLKELLARIDYGGRTPAWGDLDAEGKQRAIAESAFLARLEEARTTIESGVTVTEKELREGLAMGGGGSLQSFDQARSYLGQARSLLWLAWAVPALLLLVIGLLGGRRLSSVIAWAAVVLAIPCAIVYALAGPVYGSVARPILQDALANVAGGGAGVYQVLSEKGTSMALSIADAFASGLATQALVLLLLSAGALLVAFLLPRLSRSM